MKMLVETQRKVIFILLLLIAFSLLCEGWSNSSMSEYFNKFKNMSQTNKAENESDRSSLHYNNVAEGVRMGLNTAVQECKNQFKWDRWNCPVDFYDLQANKFEAKPTKETAYVHAIAAAGIMHEVTKICKRPDISFCGCDTVGYKKMRVISAKFDESDIWMWRGCLQNVALGEKISKLFLGTEKESRSFKQAMKAHNEKAGLKAVWAPLKIKCRCHGPTDSCVFKTCWKVLPDFSYIASKLKGKYRNTKTAKYRHDTISATNKIHHHNFENVLNDDLVYSEKSPDYCEPDYAIGHRGIGGRECKRIGKGENITTLTKWERSSCKRLCKECGHDVSRYPVTETYECNCSLHWCCIVDCKTCQKTGWQYFCVDFSIL